MTRFPEYRKNPNTMVREVRGTFNRDVPDEVFYVRGGDGAWRECSYAEWKLSEDEFRKGFK